MMVPVVQAQKRLCELLERVERGERIVITRHGRPVADLVRSGEPDPRPPKREPEFWPAGIDLDELFQS
jgi:prevent-host-death family protein